MKQNKPQSDSYTSKSDKDKKAKPVGKRYTNKLAKKLGKSPYSTPTNKDVDKYLGNGVYDEKRKDKSDKKPSKKFDIGGGVDSEYEFELKKNKLVDKIERELENSKKSGATNYKISTIEKDLMVVKNSKYELEKGKYALDAFKQMIFSIGFDKVYDLIKWEKEYGENARIGSWQSLMEGINYHLTYNSKKDIDLLLETVNNIFVKQKSNLAKLNSIPNVSPQPSTVAFLISDSINRQFATPTQFYTLNQYLNDYSFNKYANGGGVGRIKVGTFDETQLKNKEDKKAIEKAQKETGLKYIDSKIIKKGGKMFMEVYLIPTDEYLKSSKFANGGGVGSEISKPELEQMVGRKLNGWNDDVVYHNGKTYKKCFLKPYYKTI